MRRAVGPRHGGYVPAAMHNQSLVVVVACGQSTRDYLDVRLCVVHLHALRGGVVAGGALIAYLVHVPFLGCAFNARKTHCWLFKDLP